MKPLLKNARLCALCLVNSPFKTNHLGIFGIWNSTGRYRPIFLSRSYSGDGFVRVNSSI